MIDAEKLLGKVLSSAMSNSGRRKKSRRRNSDDLVGNLLGGLTSGKGLITAIGLGVGAYEIFKSKSTTAPSTAPPPVSPPPNPSRGEAPSPPPLPSQQKTSISETNNQKKQIPKPTDKTSAQNLALLLIQTMVAAAHADGTLDAEEERQILTRLQQDQGLDREEKQFLLTQLHHPKTIDELVAGVHRPEIAQTMYSLAASTIVIDTPAERQWLDQLATALSLSDSMKHFIENEL